MYSALIRPIITYAAPVWAYTNITQMGKLQIMQNKILRIATKAPPRTRNTDLHRTANIPTLDKYILKIATKLYATSAANTINPLIQQIGSYDPKRFTKYKTPKLIFS